MAEHLSPEHADPRGERHELSSDDVFVVRGGNALRGELRVNGAKNSALKLMAATVLAEGTFELTNVPAIADVPVMADILRGVGAEVAVEGNGVTVVMGEPHWNTPREHVTKIRASISILGALLARCGRARIALPGGDRIGARSIDMHLAGLEAMGASWQQEGDEVEVRAADLHGADIALDFPSVGATENIVGAAVLARGTTTVENAAREPEVQDLCNMLNAMGADIEGIGSPSLVINGVDRLHACAWETVPDRIEAGTWAVAAAITGGDVTLTHVRPGDLRMPLDKMRAAGVHVEEGPSTIRVKAGGGLRAVNFVTLPYPGLPTDMQPQMMVLLSQAEGTSRCTENVFESRFTFVEQFARFGADIEIDGHHALIRGPRPLRGAEVPGLDVRAGAAAVLAGLIADGETRVHDVHHIDRGYAGFIERLTSLGADVERVTRRDA